MHAAAPRSVRPLYLKANDDRIYAAFGRFVFLTVNQMRAVLDCKFDYISIRLRRFHETGSLGRAQTSDFAPYLYFISEQGANEAILRGAMHKKWYILKKSLLQIPHEVGITDCQIALSKAFPAMEDRRWRHDLQHDFDGEVPDLFFDLHDGVGWCPFEFERMNPVSHEKLEDYARKFDRTYIVVQTAARLNNLMRSLVETLPTTKLWFTTAELLLKNPKGKIWCAPKNWATKAYSIIKPEA